ncbi:MAG: glycosyltransferase family 4 protein [Planctomycetaceae bacterium]|nr:glycosyltransferase family 4 protein [Planctomycetaceae bacterium]
MFPWKVLHVETGRYLHGGAQQVVHLVTGLAEHGIQSVLACSKGSEVAAALAGVAARVEELPISGELDFLLTSRLLRLAREEQIDLVHLHSRRGADLFGGLAGRWGRWPVVLSRRVDTPESRLVCAVKYRLFDRVIAISECIERVLRAGGVPASKLRCVHSGVDPAPFEQPADRGWVCREFGAAESDLLVGLVAQLIPRKGHAVLLEAMEHLRAGFPHLRLILFGRGPLQANLREEISRRDLTRQVQLAGFRPDLPRIVPALDLVVHPALAEGLGVALIQAAAAGVPIVGARAGGIPEIVRHDENGLLVEPGDSMALAAAMKRLLTDEPLRRRLGDAGRDLVARQFTYDRMVAGNLEVYRELLEPRAIRAA